MHQLGSRRVEAGGEVLGAGVDRGAAARSNRGEREDEAGYGGEDRQAEQDAQRIELRRERREGRGGEDAESAGVGRGREKGKRAASNFK